jgi:hypothetical protein
LPRIEDQGSDQHKDEIIILAIGNTYSIVHLLNDQAKSPQNQQVNWYT